MDLHRNKEADAVRAFALLGICIVNMPFLGLTTADILLPTQSTSEQFAVFFMAAFAQMKFFLYSLFCLAGVWE
ncbi:hypothetical protein QWI17_18915 [Gilvimarinus sp. SDUM040013]|uniref:Uncharacterized protein n=1 Tax=Gilvimarinus gilvus TaxID=3058038 RepID=A0ABU4RV11_9GAMM|nr:hypothetical protein [Gilvimarinus sp. SDUM040013]MDO3387924.1 hypothetical protein [Gilvimarinus sp. SDUM040013]MDX6848705.1 hypothetical protein [Gilvimarinus sp. SDUM040013]